MKLYEVDELEKEIELIAQENEGEIPAEKFQELIVAQTSSLESIERMIKYVNHLEHFVSNADLEIVRINTQKLRAKNIIENIKKYLTPYIKSKGKLNVGTFTLGTRKSTSVEFDDVTLLTSKWRKKQTTITNNPDKVKIKAELAKGKKVKGAYLKENTNLTIK